MDVDEFKTVNDTFGHPRGDEVLAAIGSILRRCTQGRGVVAGRYGGDEFLLLAPNHTEEELHALMDRVLREIAAEPRLSLSPEHKVSCSIGIASAFLPAKILPKELIERADQATYSAKAEGKGRIVRFSPKMERRIDTIDVAFNFQGVLSIEKGSRIEITRWRHHPGQDELHFEAQAVMVKGGSVESDTVRVMSTVTAWMGRVAGRVVSFHQLARVTEFTLTVERSTYENELRPSCRE